MQVRPEPPASVAVARLDRRGIRRDEDAPGHGIGLSIVKSLIEELGGSIEFTTSAALGGLRVCIRLDRDAGEI